MVVVGIWSKPAGRDVGSRGARGEDVDVVVLRELKVGASAERARSCDKQEGIRKGRQGEERQFESACGREIRWARAGEEKEVRGLARSLSGGDGERDDETRRGKRSVRTMAPSKVHAAASTE